MPLSSRMVFAEDFDTPVMPTPKPELGPVLGFSAEEMAACREAAWQEGHAAGRAAVQQVGLDQLRQHLATIATVMSDTRGEALAQAEALAEELARLLLAALAAALPDLCAAYGATEIRAVATEILPPLRHEPQVRVQVAPEHIPALRAQLATLDWERADNIHLIAADDFAPSDIVIRWQYGDAVRNVAQIWNSITAILAPHGLHPADPQPQPAQREPAHAE